MDRKSIEDHILETEENLKIAAAIVESWTEARHRLADDFLSRLEQALIKKLPDWKFERWGRYFIDGYSDFYAWKPSWEGEYCVTLECGGHGQKMAFGVWRDEDAIKGRVFSPAILSIVKKHFPSAKAQKWWEAAITLRSPETDWRPPETLWRMHSDADFLTQVAEQLYEVAVISEPVIDAMMKTVKPRPPIR
jgi:hypothetical protein